MADGPILVTGAAGSSVRRPCHLTVMIVAVQAAELPQSVRSIARLRRPA